MHSSCECLVSLVNWPVFVFSYGGLVCDKKRSGEGGCNYCPLLQTHKGINCDCDIVSSIEGNLMHNL